MKKAFSLVILILVAGSVFITYSTKTTASKEVYQQQINDLLAGKKLDGPEKSFFRDVIMTMDPATGEINNENVRSVFKQKKQGRVAEEDFKWQQINSDIAGRVRSVMVDPNDANKLWAGAVTGGLWYNPDFRNNAAWLPVSDDWESMSIACIAYDPANTQVFYVGTGESFTSVNIYRESSSSGTGIYKTTDGGTSWTLLASTQEFDYVNDIVVRDENGTSVVYAGVASGTYQGEVFSSDPSDGLYRSADEGASWTQVLPDVAGFSFPYAVADIELTDEGELFVGTMRNLTLEGAGVVLQSTDGLSWSVEDRHVQQIRNEFGPDAIPGRVRLASGGGIVYAVATGGILNSANQLRDNPSLTNLMRLENGTWSDFDGPNPSWASIPWHALALEVDPNDENRLAIGGLDAYALSDATSAGTLSWIRVSDWVSMYHFSDYLKPYYGLENSDSVINHFVHADIHDIAFVGNSSDEVVMSNDGGVHYSSDFAKSYGIPDGERLDAYANFRHINNSFATTQYYTVALHPESGNNEILAGAQDNSTHTNEDGKITYEHMIGGGDGAYCFFDSDNPELRITSSQINNYNIWIDEVGYYYGFSSGTFINPATYDDRSNLLYANMAVDGGFELLITSLQGEFLDNLAVLNINKFLQEDDLGMDTLTVISLGTGTSTAFSALKISPYESEDDATMVLGNQVGDVYYVTGLPSNPTSIKIDNDALPAGYISSIDIGDSSHDILVTFSNYGTQSVWYTSNRGGEWKNLERNLPDVPVRHGIFNPLDDQKVLLATEVGIWGLENIQDESEQWVSYNSGFPNVRVDMIQARGADSVIVAATHGRGLFLGKFNQGDKIEEPLEVPLQEIKHDIYPNPTKGMINFDFEVSNARVFSLGGKQVQTKQSRGGAMDLSELDAGFYIVVTTDSDGREERFKLLKE